MALSVPQPVLLVLSAAIEALLLLKIAPSFLPGYGFNWAFMCFVALNFTLWLVYWLVIYPTFLTPLRSLPLAKGGYPFLGHWLSQFSFPRGADYLRFVREIQNDGLIRLRGFFNGDMLLVTHPKALAEILVVRPYDFPKPDKNRDFLRRLIGDGLVVTEGTFHKHQRKHSMPSFSFRQIKRLYPLFWDKSLKMVKGIDAKVFGQSIDKHPTGVTDIEYWAPKATLDIIGVAGLGRDFDTLKNSDDEMVKHYEELTSTTIGQRMLSVVSLMFNRQLADLVLPSEAKRLDETTAKLRAICRQFVREKGKQISQKDDDSIDTLATLMKSQVFSEEELVDQLLTIIAAGHETTSSSFTWITYLLALHPDVQTRLRAEIHAALPVGFSPTNNPDLDIATTLESLPLLNGVCSEGLRVFPSVPMTVRTAKHDTTLIGQPIAAGTLLILSPWAINKSPTIWGPDANEFKPERWINSETGKPNQTGGGPTNYAIMTFLHGPRSCIGQGFARAELRALVAAFVAAFEWTMADPNEEVIAGGIVTTKPRDGLRVKLTKVRDW